MIKAEASRHTVLVLLVVCVCVCVYVYVCGGGGEGFGDERMYGQFVRVASVTTDIETGLLLIIKRCLCPIAFCNYKCLHIGPFPNSVLFFTSI